MKDSESIIGIEKQKKRFNGQFRALYGRTIFFSAQQIVRHAILSGTPIEKARADILRELSFVFNDRAFCKSVEERTTRYDK